MFDYLTMFAKKGNGTRVNADVTDRRGFFGQSKISTGYTLEE